MRRFARFGTICSIKKHVFHVFFTDVFHAFYIVQMVPNGAKHHMLSIEEFIKKAQSFKVEVEHFHFFISPAQTLDQ